MAGPVLDTANCNPAVTLGLALAGKFPWNDVVLYIVAQVIGAMLGAFLTWIVYRDHFNETADAGLQHDRQALR